MLNGMARRQGSANQRCHVLSSFGARQRPCSLVLALMVSLSGGFSFSQTTIQGQRNLLHTSSYSSSSIRLQSSSSSPQISLTENIRQAYDESQTDGILQLARSSDFRSDVTDLITATLEATEENSGQVASILNGFIGACSFMDNKEAASDRVSQLLEAYDELEESNDIRPDIVTYSLAYNVFILDSTASDLAEMALDRASRMSKKLAGSKRRKVLAASRRKKEVSCTSAEDDMKELIGDDFQVLHETDDLFVINKPSGVSCFHKKTTTAGKIKGKKRKSDSHASFDISLEDALLKCGVPLSTLNPEGLGLVHRLDRGSSGCLVLAKTEEMHAKLVSEFFLRGSNKTYLTIVSPVPKDDVPEEGEIISPVDGRPAISKYNILERYGETAALMQFDIYTGRKHQIRVHAASLDSPVLFDDLYSSKSDVPALSGELKTLIENKAQFLLHASKLNIPNYDVDVEAPIPSWWEPIINELKDQ